MRDDDDDDDDDNEGRLLLKRILFSSYLGLGNDTCDALG